jgi:serine phosphatase RsbU (regulator of sigma subunit)
MSEEVEVPEGQTVAAGIPVPPEAPIPSEPMEHPVVRSEGPFVNVTPDAAHVLVETLFAGSHQAIPRVQYAVAYKIAEGRSGGDIIDVFHYDNDSVSIAIADIAGKGTQAAVHAAMIKYALRAFASNGMVPENAVRGLDRLYLENNAFEGTPNSFASLFFGVVDSTRRFLHYTNAGHEPVLLVQPDGSSCVLAPTAPIVGVFESQQSIFKQALANIDEHTLLVATTDGVTEARNESGEQFGMERLIDVAATHRTEGEGAIAKGVLAAVEAFSSGKKRDDIAILAMRFF